MKKNFKKYFLLVFALAFLISCGDIRREVDKNLNELKEKTGFLDSLVNNKADKVIILDSLINSKSDKAKILDSLINKTSSEIDSISKEKIKTIEKIVK